MDRQLGTIPLNTPVKAPNSYVLFHGMKTTTDLTSDAISYFSNKLRFETDVSDVEAALKTRAGDTVVFDSRSKAAWDQGHVPGAIHLPTAEIAERANDLVPDGADVVVYCWGPGCNGATRAALAFSQLGIPVREMIGGFEYWVHEGFTYETDHGQHQRPVNDLTAPSNDAECGCSI